MFQNLLKKLKKLTKRRGRGYGSGKGGHTVGFGQKGQKVRGKGEVRPYFEGGNTPFHRRIPKYRGRGFKGLDRWVSVNIRWLAERITEPDVVVDIPFLKQLGVRIPQGKKVRIYGKVELKVPFKVKGIYLTQGARESIENAKKD